MAGKAMKRAVLEVGGKNSLIVLADADLDCAVSADARRCAPDPLGVCRGPFLGQVRPGRTRMCLGPEMNVEGSHSVWPAFCRPGRRVSIWRNIASISTRATCAPRQKCCPPPPKATWSLGVRRDVEALWLVERARIAIGRPVVHDDLLAGLICRPPSSVSARGGPPHVDHRACPAEHLLDGGGKQRRGPRSVAPVRRGARRARPCRRRPGCASCRRRRRRAGGRRG